MSLQVSLVPSAEGAAVAVEGSLAEERIEDLSYQILHREIEFERFYLNYRVFGTADPKWRRLRYYALQVGATGAAMACNTIFLKLSKQGLKAPGVQNFGRADADTDDGPDSPQEAAEQAAALTTAPDNDGGSGNGNEATTNRSTTRTATSTANRINSQGTDRGGDASELDTNRQVRAAFIMNTISTLLDGASNGIELSSSLLTCYKNKRNNVDPASTVQRAVARVKEIDTLIAEREALVQSNQGLPSSAIHRAEGRVLKTFRDWCLSEFADVYAEVKSTHTSCNVYYVLAIAADALYLSGSILGLKALSPGKEYLNGPAITNSIVGDSIAITSAPGSAFAAKFLYKYHRNKLEDKLKQELGDIEGDAKSAMAELNKEILSADLATLRRTRSVRERASAYLLWAGRYDRYIDKELIEMRHQSKVALQGELSGPMISGTYLATDVMAAIGFYKFPNDVRRASSLGYAGSISSISANSSSLFLTNYWLFSEIVRRKKLRKKGMLPEQLLAERFKTLDDVDKMIRPQASKPM